MAQFFRMVNHESCPQSGKSAARVSGLQRVFAEGGYQLAAESGDIRDYASPNKVAIAEGGFVDPESASVHEIVFDAKRAGGAPALDDASRNRDEATMADDANRLACRMQGSDELSDDRMAPELIWGPAPRNDQARQSLRAEGGNERVGRDREPILAPEGPEFEGGGEHLGTLFLKSHARDKVLKILDAGCDKCRDGLAMKSHV